jgi:hypothetical protein
MKWVHRHFEYETAPLHADKLSVFQNLSTENYYFFSPGVALDASKSDHCGVPSSVADTLLEVLLVSGLPLDQSQIASLPTDDRQTARVAKEIARVAKDMIEVVPENRTGS